MVDFTQVQLNSGFWKDLYNRNANVSIYAVQKQFENTNRFEAMRFTYAQNANQNLHIYYDSDVAKWIEAVAYLLQINRKKYADLEAFCDALIASLARHQREDGYINSYFLQVAPDKIFTNRSNHELYCIGHLAEAAVAYDKVTGKHALLQVIERAMECVYQTFIVQKTAPFATAGHQEIKLALMRLYYYTGNAKYLEMTEYFVHMRGANQKDIAQLSGFANEYHHQDHAKAEELISAEGHAVRALYYMCGVADLAVAKQDKALMQACKRVYHNIVTKKMYITGGVGSTANGESFAIDYSLPNSTAYSESCAAIALMMFCKRMLAIERDSKYSNTVERVLYNGFLSSTSLDGKSFFYENPLEINLAERNVERGVLPAFRQRFPITQRVEVFECSCCPPNINRVLASIADYFYTEQNNVLYIEQYVAATLPHCGVEVQTQFPLQDTVTVTGKNYPYKQIAIRVPDWCQNPTFSKAAQIVNGYAYFTVDKNFTLSITYPQTARFVYANTQIFNNVGRVALCYGPVVYCLEGIDNGGTITDLFVDTQSAINRKAAGFHPLYNFTCNGVRVVSNDELYTQTPPQATPVMLTFIPYYTFANRGEQNMQVWVNATR